MPSKTSKKTKTNICQHVYTLGKLKGKKCGKGCRDGFCNNHKKAKTEYKAKWFQEQQQKRKEETKDNALNKIYNCKSKDELPSIEQLEFKYYAHRNKYIYLTKKVIGYEIQNNNNQDKQIKALRIFQYGKCKCVSDYHPPQNEIDDYRELCEIRDIPNVSDYDLHLKDLFGKKYVGPANMSRYTQPNKNLSIDEIINKLESEKKCTACDHFQNNCKLCLNISICNQSPYFVAKKKITNLQLEKLKKKRDRFKEKYEISKESIKAAKEMELILNKDIVEI